MGVLFLQRRLPAAARAASSGQHHREGFAAREQHVGTSAHKPPNARAFARVPRQPIGAVWARSQLRQSARTSRRRRCAETPRSLLRLYVRLRVHKRALQGPLLSVLPLNKAREGHTKKIEAASEVRTDRAQRDQSKAPKKSAYDGLKNRIASGSGASFVKGTREGEHMRGRRHISVSRAHSVYARARAERAGRSREELCAGGSTQAHRECDVSFVLTILALSWQAHVQRAMCSFLMAVVSRAFAGHRAPLPRAWRRAALLHCARQRWRRFGVSRGHQNWTPHQSSCALMILALHPHI